MLPPDEMPPTCLAPNERTAALLRTNAKLFYERRHEVSGEVEAALAQLASLGLAVTDRNPISHHITMPRYSSACPGRDEFGVFGEYGGVYADESGELYIQPIGFVTEQTPVYFGDRVILELV